MQNPAENAKFYQVLAPVDHFIDVTVAANYRPLPADWLIVLTDVRGSTKAINEGRYRDVNVLGASTIVAILNALPDIEVPYVFGGDGATIAVPPAVRAVVEGALKASQVLAQKKFNLDLRTGIVPLATLRQMGTDVQVAKMRAGTSGGLAMFRGGGIALAESLVKNPATSATYQITVSEKELTEGDFEGLQCRWDPVRAKSGLMISLLVVARVATEVEGDKIYREVVEETQKIVGSSGAPVKREILNEQVKSRWFRPGSHEVRVMSSNQTLWQSIKYRASVVFQMLALRWMFERGTKGIEFDPEKYLNDLAQSTDFQKFDDTLRMVLDCTPQEKHAIEAYLENERKAERLFYGLHVSDSALMTCLVFNWSHHIHLIDGAGGGYALAAVQLKAQMKDQMKDLAK
jgi:Protein of unknown function (DUF3095)